MKYLSLNEYLKLQFGCKVYKLAIDGGFTCPNRDGTLGNRGCIFCSGSGSGDFAVPDNISVTKQIESAKERVSKKIKDGKYIAYFQSFTNTYAPVDILKNKFSEAISHPDIVAISIGTRPDCLSEDVLNLLEGLNKIKPVWVELGLQTMHEQTARFIRRGYTLNVYDEAVRNLKSRGIYVITHVILGLPSESEEMMLDTVRYICGKKTSDDDKLVPAPADGIKLQLLHIIKGTDLGTLYLNTCQSDTKTSESDDALSIPSITDCKENCFSESSECDDSCIEIMKDFRCMELDEYTDLIIKCLEIIPDNIAIHRMTGDGDKKTLIAPLWSADKKRVLNTLNKKLNAHP